MILLPIIKIYT